MKNIFKITKRDVFIFVIAVILCSIAGVIADTINSNEVLYDNTLSTSSATDVKDAIDDLYDKVVHDNSGYRLIGHIDESISDGLIGGLYRYQGTSVNNYICFGTTNKNTCTSDTAKYMYRIIGFDSGGKMKLIKNEILYYTSWDYNSSYGYTWDSAGLKSKLNGTDFLSNTSYVPDDWKNRISLTNWHVGVITNADVLPSELESLELSFPTVSAKIGLLYLHDYNYAYSSNANCTTGNDSNNCKNSWIHSNVDEWVIQRGILQNYTRYLAWTINYNYGSLEQENVTETNGVRPVFFLNSTETIASGSGTITDPYILS